MRVLFISSPAATHFLPMLPLVRALQAAGHEVLVTGQPDVTGPAEAAGLATVTHGDAFHYEDLCGGKGPRGPRPIETVGRPPAQQIDGAAQMWRNHTSYHLPDYLELARDWKADLVVSDHMDFAAPIVGEVLGIPSVEHRWGVNPTSTSTLRMTLMWLGPLCGRLGLDSVPGPSLILDPAPPALRSTDAPEGRPIRPLPHTDGRAPWAYATSPGAPGCRVAVALGGHTLELGGAPLVRIVVAVLERTGGVEAVVSAPPRFREAIGALPKTMSYTDETAPGVLFPGADLVVHHGGAGSTLGAAALGVPQLVLPQVGDQFIAGDKVADAGAGISLDSAGLQNNDTHLTDAVRALLSDPGYRQDAARLRQQIQEMPGAAEAVGVLEDLVSHQTVRA
ncbi:nucleotide disphospho-sugar-binding domain-containing protein [Streptomyces sp. BK340]|uniref:nucleotide disphospho-sugar-binding domain-containing protein n=1 Tax=Streptomyces sp. BK340 TaxID=2572903 RepID=UPI0011A0BC8F|nr:nucleotide disphospho-sugar-binding domain-containing protein [Streptomyces sp. BK340]TVZ80479.1 glycosyltransferase [Streptomyces sp. BK340]